VIISNDLWRKRFAGNPQAVGKAVTLSGVDYTRHSDSPLISKRLAKRVGANRHAETARLTSQWYLGEWNLEKITPRYGDAAFRGDEILWY
jgi:hypothetical protein